MTDVRLHMVLVFLMLVTVSCSKQTQSVQQERIVFGAEDSVDSRTKLTVNDVNRMKSDIGGFNVVGIKDRSSLLMNANPVWNGVDYFETSPGYYMDTSCSYGFYAVYPAKTIDVSADVHTVSFDYTLGSDEDLLVAENQGVQATPVSLTFEHALATLRISAYETDPSYSFTVTGIQLRYCNTGTYTFIPNEERGWNASLATLPQINAALNIPVTSSNQNNPTPVYAEIPVIPGNIELRLIWTMYYSATGETVQYSTIDTTVPELAMGQKYHIVVSLSKHKFGKVKFIVNNVVDWVEVEEINVI